MELIQRLDDAKRLWAAWVPACPAPDDRQFLLWARRFSDAQIEKALWRVGTKFKFGMFTVATDHATVHKYTTGLLLNLEREKAA